jgi:hypothetical protein
MVIDATIRKGADYLLEVEIPGDRSDYTVIAYRVGRRLTNATELQFTGTPNANGSVVSVGAYDGTHTTVSITFKRQDTESLAAMRHVHELILADPLANRQSVLTDDAESDAYLTVLGALPSA